MKTVNNASAPRLWLRDTTLHIQFPAAAGPHTVELPLPQEPTAFSGERTEVHNEDLAYLNRCAATLRVLESTLRAAATTEIIGKKVVPTQWNLANAMREAIAAGRSRLVGKKRSAPEGLTIEELGI